MNGEDEESDEYEMLSGSQKLPEIELPEIDFGPVPPLSQTLNGLLNTQLREYSLLESRLREAEEVVRKQELEKEEKKRREEEELVFCSPEYTLKALHQVVRNPEIVRYLESVGDLIVFELDRGMGKNIILFSKIDLATYRSKMEQLEAQKPYIENSRRTQRDKNKVLSDIERKILETSREMEYVSKWGGNIFLYSERDGEYHHLDFYGRDMAKANRSLSFLQVYFGKNSNFEDSFHKFNTPEKIMDLVTTNLKLYGGREFVKLEKKIEEIEQGK